MFYPHMIVLADALITTGTASAFPVAATAPTSAYIDHAGPGVLYYGLECVSASNAGAGLWYIRYTSRDGNAMTASGALCVFSAVSGSASGAISVNLASNSTLDYFVSCTAAIGATNAAKIRYWLLYMGADSVGPASATTGLGMLAG